MLSAQTRDAADTSESLQVGGAWDQEWHDGAGLYRREVFNYLHPVLRPIHLDWDQEGNGQACTGEEVLNNLHPVLIGL